MGAPTTVLPALLAAFPKAALLSIRVVVEIGECRIRVVSSPLAAL